VGYSDTQIWRLERAGQFPQRVQLTEGGAVGWYEDEINAWVDSRIRAPGKRPSGRRSAE
jgi:prophage regulatory protein